MPSKTPLYWDSCVFLDRLKRKPERIALLESLTDGALAGDFLIVTSSVALAEVIRLAELGPTSPDEVKTIEDFFENPWISVRLVDEDIAKRAASLRRSHRLKTCDAIHVATALRFKLPVFHTYDGLAQDGTIKPPPFLLGCDGMFADDDGQKLRIIVPTDPRPKPPGADQLNMFDAGMTQPPKGTP